MSQEKIERWNEVDGNLGNEEKLQAFLDSTTDAYAILQLRRTDQPGRAFLRHFLLSTGTRRR